MGRKRVSEVVSAATRKRLARDAKAARVEQSAFEEGQTARLAKLPRNCPLRNPARVNHWLRGWDDADAQIRTWRPAPEAERRTLKEKLSLLRIATGLASVLTGRK